MTARVVVNPTESGWEVSVADGDDIVVCITGAQVKITSVADEDDLVPLEVALE